MRTFLATAVCLLVPFFLAGAQQSRTQPQLKNHSASCPNDCSMRNMQSGATGQKMSPQMSMNERGETGMGFSQTATTHHFFLHPDGGVIQVEVKDPQDTSDLDKIRMHLEHIAQAFAKGDFDIPMFIHDTTPSGVPEMKRLRDNISYTFGETRKGGRVVISTTDTDAIAAIHQFLRFQIREHKTGDPTEVRLRSR
jgi:hypothetical protein